MKCPNCQHTDIKDCEPTAQSRNSPAWRCNRCNVKWIVTNPSYLTNPPDHKYVNTRAIAQHKTEANRLALQFPRGSKVVVTTRTPTSSIVSSGTVELVKLFAHGPKIGVRLEAMLETINFCLPSDVQLQPAAKPNAKGKAEQPPPAPARMNHRQVAVTLMQLAPLVDCDWQVLVEALTGHAFDEEDAGQVMAEIRDVLNRDLAMAQQ